MRIILLEDNNIFKCITDVDENSLLLSLSKYKYFYGKKIIYKNKEIIFNGINLNFLENMQNVNFYEIDVYVKLTLRQFDEKQKKEEKLTPQQCLDIFLKEYEKKYSISYVINNKMNYLKKFRRLMDEFYKNGLKDLHIKNYIKRCVLFGNHKGEIIYINFLFNDKVIQNYLLYIKDIKDIDAVWPYLDTNLSLLEKKKIKYLMNINYFDDFNKIEKLLCLHFYKKVNKKIYKKLTERIKYEKIQTKIKIFELLCQDYNITIQELLEKTKHNTNYLLYDYTKKQLKEALQ